MGDATARTLTYQSRIKDAYFYPNSAWITPFIGGSYKFEQDGVLNLDAKDLFFFYATGVTPAMTEKMVGQGSQYAGAFVDAKGNPFLQQNRPKADIAKGQVCYTGSISSAAKSCRTMTQEDCRGAGGCSSPCRG